MVPNTPQSQPLGPASLPPMPAQPLPPAGQPPMQSAPQAPSGVMNPSAAAVLHARQLVEQYAQDPYRMAEAMNQLKSGYIAQQHHITPNVAGN